MSMDPGSNRKKSKTGRGCCAGSSPFLLILLDRIHEQLDQPFGVAWQIFVFPCNDGIRDALAISDPEVPYFFCIGKVADVLFEIKGNPHAFSSHLGSCFQIGKDDTPAGRDPCLL